MAKIKLKNIDLSYTKSLGTGAKTAIFLHGWGANKELMQNCFEKYFSKYCRDMYFLDFAGFGASAEPKTAQNSQDFLNQTQEFCTLLNLKIDLILGHSFGGKIAALYAQKNHTPQLILCASAGLKLPKSFKTKCKIALAKISKFLGIKGLRKLLASKDGANLSPVMYETFKNVVDENFAEEFSQIDSKTLLLWGKNDQATTLEIGEKINKLIKNSQLKIYEGDHFFFIKNDLSKEIDEFLLS